MANPQVTLESVIVREGERSSRVIAGIRKSASFVKLWPLPWDGQTRLPPPWEIIRSCRWETCPCFSLGRTSELCRPPSEVRENEILSEIALVVLPNAILQPFTECLIADEATYMSLRMEEVQDFPELPSDVQVSHVKLQVSQFQGSSYCFLVSTTVCGAGSYLNSLCWNLFVALMGLFNAVLERNGKADENCIIFNFLDSFSVHDNKFWICSS